MCHIHTKGTNAVQQKMAGPALVCKVRWFSSFESEDGYPRAGPSKFSKHRGRGHSHVAVAQYSYRLSNVFSQLLQNALNIVFVLNIVWYIYNLSQIYLLYFILMREGCNKFCACSFMWAPISDRYYVSSRQKYRMRFRCTSMRQTLVTDRGRPKNQYPDKLSVLVSCAKPVALSISLQPSVRALRTGNIWWIGGMYLHTDAFTPIDQWMIEC